MSVSGRSMKTHGPRQSPCAQGWPAAPAQLKSIMTRSLVRIGLDSDTGSANLHPRRLALVKVPMGPGQTPTLATTRRPRARVPSDLQPLLAHVLVSAQLIG